MRLSLAAGLLLATSTFALAQSTNAPVGQDVPTVAKVRVDTDAQEAITFSDPGNATAKAFSAAMGISIGEATSRLRARRVSRALSPSSLLGIRTRSRA